MPSVLRGSRSPRAKQRRCRRGHLASYLTKLKSDLEFCGHLQVKPLAVEVEPTTDQALRSRVRVRVANDYSISSQLFAIIGER